MKLNKVLIGLLICSVACNSNSLETPSGLKVKVLKKGDGVKPVSGQFAVYNFVIRDSKDSVWASTYERGYPEFLKVQDTATIQRSDMMGQVLTLLSAGDSATFNISMKKLFRDFAKTSVPPDIDSTLDLRYTLCVRDIINQEEFEDYREKITTEYYAFVDKNAAVQLNKDTLAIDSFLESKGIQAIKLPSGLRYVITRPGEGPTAQSGQTVLVNYAGYLLNNEYFDTNVKSVAQEQGIYDPRREMQAPYEPYPIVIDETSVISGWHEALKLLNKGSQGTFYIPSTLGYGAQAVSNQIKANSILIFDIEAVDIKQ